MATKLFTTIQLVCFKGAFPPKNRSTLYESPTWNQSGPSCFVISNVCNIYCLVPLKGKFPRKWKFHICLEHGVEWWRSAVYAISHFGCISDGINCVASAPGKWWSFSGKRRSCHAHATTKTSSLSNLVAYLSKTAYRMHLGPSSLDSVFQALQGMKFSFSGNFPFTGTRHIKHYTHRILQNTKAHFAFTWSRHIVYMGLS